MIIAYRKASFLKKGFIPVNLFNVDKQCKKLFNIIYFMEYEILKYRELVICAFFNTFFLFIYNTKIFPGYKHINT